MSSVLWLKVKRVHIGHVFRVVERRTHDDCHDPYQLTLAHGSSAKKQTVPSQERVFVLVHNALEVDVPGLLSVVQAHILIPRVIE